MVHVKVDGMRLEKRRRWGACWLGLTLWDDLELDAFWNPPAAPHARRHRMAACVEDLGGVYRLIDPGSEWRLHRQWYDRSAMADRLGKTKPWRSPIPCIAAWTGYCPTKRRCSAT